jgi:hypothetical protein
VNLQLNLATKVYVDFRKVNMVLFAVVSLVVVWCVYGFYTLVLNYTEIQQLTEYKTKSFAKTSGGKVSDAEFNRLMAEIKFANSILDKRRYDWLTQLDNLEGVVPDGVSLNAITPGEKSDLIRLAATARNFAAVRKFIENLEGSSKFADVFLADLKFIKEGTLNKGISFSVTCKALI